ncbi:SusD/RagB family nutrient-binding outer membrane lipoprotein [Hymenobacter sediminis]|uniref:SusD/RagB family nutrient-binding outer membrane lipoprotein n=1 Tax=Hymenobacter sediminis TaxID=2218621 RepID=UPI000DA65D4F|nr:SusD/RagB family nutrient-binding outer membrane lipoprotein [Hymenobacter sediminis]RPD50281.1 SusD/RagB family nutrient-binding outer membrane lipoprotein [Hymenobacter sediminis]
MKQHRYITLTLAASFAFASASCSKDEFLDVNNDPNSPSTVSAGVSLTNIEVATGFNMGNDVNRATSVLIQHNAALGNQVRDFDVYNLRAVDLGDTWNRFYSAIFNGEQMIQTANSTSSPAYVGVGKILKAYNYSVLTDMFGDVPYSQGAQGLNNLAPRFDKQEDIYKGNAGQNIQSLFDLVREGLADIDKASALKPTAADDPIYQGDMAKWKKFGNTLLLKFANTISRKDPALAKTVIEEVLAKGAANYISSNADDFQVPFGSTSGNQNPIYSFNFIGRVDDQLLSQRLLDSMVVRNDPRLPFFYTPTPARTATVNTSGTTTSLPLPTGSGFYTFTGFQNGSTNATPVLANRSKPGPYQVGPNGNAPIRLVTNFQRAFILAEAAVNGVTKAGDAQELYTEAITASMTKAGLTPAQITSYLDANPKVALLSGSNEHKINQIITQKWIAWVGNGFEAYNDYRRTGFPRLELVQNAIGDDPTKIPARFPYPTSEISSNPNNAGNPRTNERVWWDVD